MEGIYSVDLLVAKRTDTQVCLDVAVASLRTVRLHAEGDNRIRLTGKYHTLFDDALEFGSVGDNVITRRDNDVRFGILRLNAPTDICNTWCRVACCWLGKDVVDRHVGQLLAHNVHVGGVGHHPEVRHRADALEPVHSQLYQRASAAQNVDELLRVFGSAQRPETATDAARHNNYLGIHDEVFEVRVKNYEL